MFTCTFVPVTFRLALPVTLDPPSAVVSCGIGASVAANRVLPEIANAEVASRDTAASARPKYRNRRLLDTGYFRLSTGVTAARRRQITIRVPSGRAGPQTVGAFRSLGAVESATRWRPRGGPLGDQTNANRH